MVKAIIRCLSGADIYTLVAKKEICEELGIDWNKVHTSFIQKMPLEFSKNIGLTYRCSLLLSNSLIYEVMMWLFLRATLWLKGF